MEIAEKKKEILGRAKIILNELLKNEFKAIKQKVRLGWAREGFLKDLYSVQPQFIAVHLTPWIIEGEEIILLNPQSKKLFNFSNDNLKEILRHELLHIELGKEDRNVDFIIEALERNICINDRELRIVKAMWEKYRKEKT